MSPQHNSLGRYPGFGVTECFSPYDSTRVSLMSKGQEEMFHTKLSTGLIRLCSLLRSSRVIFYWSPVRAHSVVLLTRLSAIVITESSKSVAISCFSFSCSCCSLFSQRLSLLWQLFILALTNRLQVALTIRMASCVFNISTEHWTSHPTTRYHTKPRLSGL